jgi:hypothetical protein
VGSQISISIWESVDGFRTAATLQCSGSIGPVTGLPAALWDVYGPAGTNCTETIVVFGKESVRAFAQGSACCVAKKIIESASATLVIAKSP